MLCGIDSAAQRQFIWRFLTNWWVMGALSRRQLPSRRIISRKKKRNSSSNYTQHRSVLQTDKACNYSAIPNKEPAFRLMSTLRWHLMWNASHKKDIYLSKDGSIYTRLLWQKFYCLKRTILKESRVFLLDAEGLRWEMAWKSWQSTFLHSWIGQFILRSQQQRRVAFVRKAERLQKKFLRTINLKLHDHHLAKLAITWTDMSLHAKGIPIFFKWLVCYAFSSPIQPMIFRKMWVP